MITIFILGIVLIFIILFIFCCMQISKQASERELNYKRKIIMNNKK